MMAQSLFRKFLALQQESRSAACSEPEHIILSTADIIKAVGQKFESLPGFSYDEEFLSQEAVDMILSYLHFEREAELEMGYGCLEMVDNFLGTAFADRTTDAANAMIALGTAILEQLRHIRAYQNGYLFYAFHSWCGKDLVLVRFTVDRDPATLGVPHEHV